MSERREIPFGKPNTKEQKLPAVEVDNVVLWSNPDFPAIKIPVGEKSPLGLFLTKNPEINDPKEVANLGVNTEHFRSTNLSRVVFQDTEGRFYRDIDLKGTGLLSLKGDTTKLVVSELITGFGHLKDDDDPKGFVIKENAEYDRDISEKLLAAGIRSYRVLAIIELKEIIDSDGKKISIEEAKQWRLLRNSDRPVIEVRAYGTKMRIIDVFVEQPSGLLYLDDAMILVAQELGINPKDFSKDDYVKWFARTLGEQLGKLHRLGYVHTNMREHNITLDCRLVDFDTVKDIFEIEKGVNKGDPQKIEMHMVVDVLKSFTFRMAYDDEDDALERIFLESYGAALEG